MNIQRNNAEKNHRLVKNHGTYVSTEGSIPLKQVKKSVKNEENKIVSMHEKGVNTKKFSDIKHKNSGGNNNWSTFMLENGITSKPAASDFHIKRSNKPSVVKNNRTSNLTDKRKHTKAVAIDCEMVGIDEGGREDMLARVSIVNSLGDCLYDTFVSPRDEVTDYRTEVSGVRPENLENAKDFYLVQQEVADLLKCRVVVGHSLKSDFKVLSLSHPKHSIRDTSKFFRKTGKGTPSLKKLAKEYLNTTIQEGEHNSVIDAQAAMQLYNMFRKHWEKGGRSNHNSINTYLGPHVQS